MVGVITICFVSKTSKQNISETVSNTPKTVNTSLGDIDKKDVRSNSFILATKGIESKPCFANKRSFHTYSFLGNNLDTSNGTDEDVTLKEKKVITLKKVNISESNTPKSLVDYSINSPFNPNFSKLNRRSFSTVSSFLKTGVSYKLSETKRLDP